MATTRKGIRKKTSEPEERHGDDQPAPVEPEPAQQRGGPAQRRHPLDQAAHCVSTTPAVSSQVTQTVSSQEIASSSKRDEVGLGRLQHLAGLEPQPVDRQVAEVGDLLDHRLEDVVRRLPGRSRVILSFSGRTANQSVWFSVQETPWPT